MTDRDPLPAEKKRRSRKKEYPSWAYASMSDFQSVKRKQLRALKKAMEAAQNGVAYVPGYAEHWQPMQWNFKKLLEMTRTRNWK